MTLKIGRIMEIEEAVIRRGRRPRCGDTLRSKRFRTVSGRESKTVRKLALFHFSAAIIENPVPWSFFPPKPNANACYAGHSLL